MSGMSIGLVIGGFEIGECNYKGWRQIFEKGLQGESAIGHDINFDDDLRLSKIVMREMTIP